jgi:hypothetical protein
MKKFKDYESWYNEYKKYLDSLFSKIMYVLKTKDMIYKEYQFDTFCKLIYKKSSKF